MFSSPYFIIGMLSIVLIYFENIESKTAGKVYYMSVSNTGQPFFTAAFTSGMKSDEVGFVNTFFV